MNPHGGPFSYLWGRVPVRSGPDQVGPTNPSIAHVGEPLELTKESILLCNVSDQAEIRQCRPMDRTAHDNVALNTRNAPIPTSWLVKGFFVGEIDLRLLFDG